MSRIFLHFILLCIFLQCPFKAQTQDFSLHLGAGMGYSHYPFQKSYRELPEAEITKVNEVLAAGGVMGRWRFLGFGLEGHLPISSDRIYSINGYASVYPFKKLPVYIAPGVSVSYWKTHPFPNSFYEENRGVARWELNFGYHLTFDEKWGVNFRYRLSRISKSTSRFYQNTFVFMGENSVFATLTYRLL